MTRVSGRVAPILMAEWMQHKRVRHYRRMVRSLKNRRAELIQELSPLLRLLESLCQLLRTATQIKEQDSHVKGRGRFASIPRSNAPVLGGPQNRLRPLL